MGFLEWATSPWGQAVPIHIAWFLIWVARDRGTAFLIVHAIYRAVFRESSASLRAEVPPPVAADIPAHVPRHSLVARAVSLDHGRVHVCAAVHRVSA